MGKGDEGDTAGVRGDKGYTARDCIGAGSALYHLTVANDQGPYTDNQNHQHWPPQTTSHVSLHTFIGFARKYVCVFTTTSTTTTATKSKLDGTTNKYSKGNQSNRVNEIATAKEVKVPRIQ